MSDHKTTIQKQKDATDEATTIDLDAWRKTWTPEFKREQDLKAEKHKKLKLPRGMLLILNLFSALLLLIYLLNSSLFKLDLLC